MKKLAKLMAVSIMMLSCWQTTIAQNLKSQKQAAKAAAVKNMVDSVHYVFKANFANPQRGGTRALTSDYDLKVVKDSIIAYLPYFGRAYVAPNPGETEGGIKFTSTKFTYKSKQEKKGNWQIIIKPTDNNLADWRDVQQLVLNISTSGYASLQVISSNRDPISFDGYIERVGS